MPDDAFEAEEDFMANLDDDQREITVLNRALQVAATENRRLTDENVRLRGLVVSRFDHDYPPTFRQGYPIHELEEVTSAEQCTWMVGEIERLRAELEGFREGSEKMALQGIKMRRELDALRAELAALRAQEPVGVFADVNRHTVGQPPRWEQMAADSYDGAEYVYLYAAPGAQPAVSVPEGWQLVPKVPTAEMLETLADSVGDTIADHIEFGTAVWDDMLAAAPEVKP